MIVLDGWQGLAPHRTAYELLCESRSLPALEISFNGPALSALRPSCHLEASRPSLADVSARRGGKPHRVAGFFSVVKVNLRNAP